MSRNLLPRNSTAHVRRTPVRRNTPRLRSAQVAALVFMGFGIAGLWDALPRNFLTPWTITCGILLIVLLIVAVLRMANGNKKEIERPDAAGPPG